MSSVRGGYGVFYSIEDMRGSEGMIALNPPALIQSSLTRVGSGPPPVRLSDPFPASMLDNYNPANVSVKAREHEQQAATIHQWNAAVEVRLPWESSAEIAYVGNLGRNLLTIVPVNSVPFGLDGSVPANRPYPGWQGIDMATTRSHSEYNGLQFKYEKRMSRGLYLLGVVHVRDGLGRNRRMGRRRQRHPDQRAPGSVERARGARRRARAERAVPAAPLHLHRGLAAADRPRPGHRRRHVGAGRRHRRRLAGVEHHQHPHRPAGERDAGRERDRPRHRHELQLPEPQRRLAQAEHGRRSECGSDAGGNRLRFLDPAAYALQPLNTPGDAPRNSAWGPGYWTTDLSLVKRFTLGAGLAADLRIEAFNLFNRTNFQDPNGAWGTNNFGVISDAYDPRVAQVAVRLTF